MFFVLGTVHVTTGLDTVDVHSESQCALLAALIAGHGRPVSVHSLISELWDCRPPGDAENSLQSHVSRLRRKLSSAEPDRTITRLTRVSPGYQLSLTDDELDAAVFVRAVRELLTDQPSATVEFVQRIRATLAQWRGPAFGGHARGHLGRSLVDHYRQARLSALDLLYDSELLLDRCPKVVEELSALIELEPFDERFCEQLMIGLYRSGRPADALAVYRRFRERMMDELGVEPSPALRRRQMAVLQHDPDVGTKPDYLGRAGFRQVRCQSRVSDPTVGTRMLKEREKPQHQQRGGNSHDSKPGRRSEGTKYATYI